jgi:hypothetical protein
MREGLMPFHEPQPGPGGCGPGSQTDRPDGSRGSGDLASDSRPNGKATVTQLACGQWSATLPLCSHT